MTEAQDLFKRMGFDKSAPPLAQAATLTGYICDLFVHRLPEAELAKRREDGVYRLIRPQDLTGYHAMARRP